MGGPFCWSALPLPVGGGRERTMRRCPPVLCFVLLLSTAGCAEPASEPGTWTCDLPDDVEVGQVVGSVSGEAWVGASGGYSVLPIGLQISAYANDIGLTLRLVESSLQTAPAVEGQDPEFDLDDPIEDVLEDRSAPAEFALGDSNRDGADVTVAIDGEPARSTGEGEGGYLRIVEFSDEDAGLRISGCFFFEADTADGEDAVTVEAGGFVLDPM